MVSFGFSTSDLSKYNSSSLFKLALKGMPLSNEQQSSLNDMYSGINSYTGGIQTAQDQLSETDFSGYDGVVKSFKTLAELKTQSALGNINTALLGNTPPLAGSASSTIPLIQASTTDWESQLGNLNPESPQTQAILSKITALDPQKGASLQITQKNQQAQNLMGSLMGQLGNFSSYEEVINTFKTLAARKAQSGLGNVSALGNNKPAYLFWNANGNTPSFATNALPLVKN